MTTKLELTLLGETTIKLNGKPANIPSRKAEAMLLYLVCTQRPYSRELLADFFWDDRSAEQALANLRSLLSGLRRGFKPFLDITRQTVAFKEDSSHWLDTAVFQQLAQSESIEDWETAISLYQADFLAGFDIRDSRGFEEWVTLERERFQRTAVHLLRRLVQHFLDHQQYEKGIRYAARLLALAPLSEWAYRQMMLLLARNDQRAEALRQYQTCCDILVEELGIDPSPETTALYERIRAAVDIRRHNLPVAVAPFVGRAQELRQIQAQLVRPSCRLLTLVGPGGIGKTRLALKIAETAVGTFLNGVFFVPLAAVPAPEFIIPAIAEAVDFTFSGAAPPQTQLINYLQAKEMLLVLDNFEHLLKGSPLLAEMSQALPDVKLLVTSSERLNLKTEWTYEVEPLPLPEETNAGPSDAIDLFVQMAQRAQVNFALTAETQPHIAKICRLVAGVPLGIELASAWVRQLSCAEIAEELAQNIDFLQSQAGDVPDRHRSLQAVFDHSWQLLTPEEQQVLAQLTVFRGGFSREAARQVTQTSLWALTALVDKSLLHREANGRFEMLEMVRQFAAERLAELPELATSAQARQAQYFLLLLHQQEERWQTGERQLALDLLTPELENVRAAWRWAVAALEDPALADRAAGAAQWLNQAIVSLFFLYESRGWFRDGAAAYGWALAALEEMAMHQAGAQQSYGRLLVRYGRFATFLGQYEKARQVLEKAQSYLQAANDPKELSLGHSYLAIVHSFQGNYEQAMAEAETSLALTSQINHQQGVAFVQNLRGTLAQRLGDYAAARTYYETSLQLRRELGDEHGTAVVLNNLGNLANAEQDFATARRYYEESQLIFKEINYKPGQAASLGNAGVVAMRLGELDEARRLHDESLILKKGLGNRRSISISLINLGEVTSQLGEVAAARRAFHEALRLSMEIQASPLALDALVGVAGLLAQDEQRSQALQLLRLAYHHPASTRETQEKAGQQLAALAESLDLEGNLPDLAEMVAEVLRPYT
ncbi:MAG: tetratricopeptide repeat protein [Ardenticatenaceae bacterium]|nr:tetratricopeptide repeat protein [Anaerolineales bacterium]MCB9007443.1 tetratricopeptide repeat protein [Ardenticatenaceae bacterium]